MAALAVVIGLTSVSPPPVSIALYAIGDSITRGDYTTPGHRWVDLVGAYEAGRNGFTSADALAYPWAVPPSTKIVLVEFGINDYTRGIPSAIFQSNMSRLLARLAPHQIMLIAPAEPIPRWSSIEPWRDYVAVMCRLGTVVDVGVFGPELFLPDGTHPSEAGEAVIAAKVRVALAHPEGLTCPR